jgi:hypothetical protein
MVGKILRMSIIAIVGEMLRMSVIAMVAGYSGCPFRPIWARCSGCQ